MIRRLVLLLAVSTGCLQRVDVGGAGADAASGSDAAQIDVIAASDAGPPKLDILFVIDNSGGMKDKQVSLVANLQTLLDQVAASAGVAPDLHIGVVSSNVGIGGFSAQGCTGGGDHGLLQVTPRIPGCHPPTEPFIQDPPGGEVNYSGTLADTFSCIALLGTAGCGFEQHLESMRQGLDGSNPKNAGFLRDDAMLAVVVLADEDDCSAADPSVFDTSQVYSTDPLGAFQSYRCTEFGVECDGADLAGSPGEYADCAPRTDSYIADPGAYVAFLTPLKGGDPWRVFAAVIVGQPSPFTVALDGDDNPKLAPSCTSAIGTSVPAVRLIDFAAAFPRHQIASICTDDLSGALGDVGAALGLALVTPPPPQPVTPAGPPGVPLEAIGCQAAPGAPCAGLFFVLLLGLLVVFRRFPRRR